MRKKIKVETASLPKEDDIDINVPNCKCGSPAHLIDNPRDISGTVNHFYGVMCDKKHRIPMAFSTKMSAIKFWEDTFAEQTEDMI